MPGINIDDFGVTFPASENMDSLFHLIVVISYSVRTTVQGTLLNAFIYK